VPSPEPAAFFGLPRRPFGPVLFSLVDQMLERLPTQRTG
jgi:hypothetical protein